jgi:hypothetical protein
MPLRIADTIVAAGAGLMYLIDREHGRQRRTRLRDKMVSTRYQSEHLDVPGRLPTGPAGFSRQRDRLR